MSPQTGWYSDPGNPQGLRWWDGDAWTEHTMGHPAAPSTTAPPAPEPVAAAAVVDPPTPPAAAVVPVVPKQMAAPVELATSSSITLLPGADSSEPDASQSRSRWRRGK
jgi:hypothetical protein